MGQRSSSATLSGWIADFANLVTDIPGLKERSLKAKKTGQSEALLVIRYSAQPGASLTQMGDTLADVWLERLAFPIEAHRIEASESELVLHFVTLRGEGAEYLTGRIEITGGDVYPGESMPWAISRIEPARTGITTDRSDH